MKRIGYSLKRPLEKFVCFVFEVDTLESTKRRNHSIHGSVQEKIPAKMFAFKQRFKKTIRVYQNEIRHNEKFTI